MTTTDTSTPPVARGWPAVAAVAAATFSVVTTEMLPVGLLTSLAAELRAPEGVAGLTMTVPGLIAAFAAPLLTVGAGRLDRRWVLVALMALLASANLLSAVTPNLPLLVALRVLVGVSIGGVWAIAASSAVRLVPEGSVGAATSLIFSGIAVASVLGVPAGTFIGELGGWRASFAVMGVVSLVVAVALAVLLPPLPAEEPMRFSVVPQLLRSGAVRVGLFVILLLVCGHFAAYTYVRPVLEQVSSVDAGLIGVLLLAYGLAGVAGNFAGGAASARDPRRTLLLISAVLAAAVFALGLPLGVAGATAALLVWGVAYGGVSVSTQNWLLAAAPHAREAASSLFVAVFNVAIALGALLGGRMVDAISPSSAFFLAAALALAALLVAAAGRTSR
ncbi:MFS transporter [Saccharopolyspora sp. NPDC050642]|uniref:MFS transporter n=1 Tax=Saccharopolyspora sp. NPDC050642 TaxID=3157099 RepID=UPI0033FCC2D1